MIRISRSPCCGTGPSSTPSSSTAGLGPDGHPRRESALLDEFPATDVGRRRGPQYGPLHPTPPRCAERGWSKHAQKHGSTGNLLIVTLEHTVEQDGNTALVERQDVIFREAGGVTPAEGPPSRPRPEGLARDVHADRPAAVPLLRRHLQQPPHPLRPRLRDAGRALPGPRRPRAAHRDGARRLRVTAPRQSAAPPSPIERRIRCSSTGP